MCCTNKLFFYFFKRFVKFFDEMANKLSKKYDHVYLLRNERNLHIYSFKNGLRFEPEYCEQIEPPVRMIEPASAINRATQCNRESH